MKIKDSVKLFKKNTSKNHAEKIKHVAAGRMIGSLYVPEYIAIGPKNA